MGERIGITMRGADAVGYEERRDALARDWHSYLAFALGDVRWMLIPSLGTGAVEYCRDWCIDALLLSGGDAVGEDELRDTTEHALLDHAEAEGLPVLGVCRGLQLMQVHCGGELERCDRELHIATHHAVKFLEDAAPLAGRGDEITVNSYHGDAVTRDGLATPLRAVAVSSDGLVEALAHTEHPWTAIQWHPEREGDPSTAERDWLRQCLRVRGSPR